MHDAPRSWWDHDGVVHQIPDNWGVRSFKFWCGLDVGSHPGNDLTHEAVTCFWCVLKQRK